MSLEYFLINFSIALGDDFYLLLQQSFQKNDLFALPLTCIKYLYNHNNIQDKYTWGIVTAIFAFYAQVNPHLYEQNRQIVLPVHPLNLSI